MAFLTYKETRPWAKAIKTAVSTRRMPPWFADPAHGKFENDRSMSPADVETLIAWVDAGAPEGSAKQAPAPVRWVDGWNIQKPDLVVGMPAPFPIPASGKIDYQYIVVPTGLTEDKWIQMAEVRPTFRGAVHHVVVYIREPESKWLRGEAQPGIPFVPPRTTPDGKPRNDIGGAGSDILLIYTPGNLPEIWKPGQAKLIKAGSDVVFQMHYTVNGKAGADQSSVGLVFAKEPPTERVMTLSIANTRLVIPPGAPAHEVSAAIKIPNEAKLASFFPHMHLRGKSFEYTLTRMDNTKEVLLRVPKYDFNWQLTYKLAQPLKLEPGMQLRATGWFDNSPNNPFNPDPKAEVRWGEQSWEEMMIGFVDLVIDAKMDARSWFRRRPAAPAPSQPGGE
ncbi:MAG TPA: thiol-disulfide isomerase [Solibacterales bacterium]|nr:thiol-disulfide isomerase [Bryobacterales bacterium]